MDQDRLAAASVGRSIRVTGGNRLDISNGSQDTLVLDDGVIQPNQPERPELQSQSIVIDASGLTVAPGFIDLQINGGYGFDLVSDPASLWSLGRELPRHGVTSFLPTIITSPTATTDAAIAALGQRPPDYVGAEPIGLHFEGPMLSPQRPGAHPVAHLKPADRSVIEGWSRESGVRLVTIAPELRTASDVIAELVRRGVTVSAGHTEADARQAEAGRQAGITMVTHLFNAMAPLGHRQPNLVGLALAEPGLIVGMIVDGVHVDPMVVAATWNAKGPEGVILVTDAVAPMGLGPGRYEFARHAITADAQAVRNEAGNLAGSILAMDQAVRNLRDYTGCSTSDALSTVTSTPAGVINLEDRGRLTPGMKADLVLLTEDLDVQLTICGGQLSYVSDGAIDRIVLPSTG